MKLAVLTAACGRSQLTERTLASFVQQNGPAQNQIRLIALDHSTLEEDMANAMSAEAYGWHICAIAGGRLGLMWALRNLVWAAADHGATHVLWLENDWESERPLFDALILSQEVDCVRLYGREKQKDGKRPAGTNSLVTGQPLHWGPISAHWDGAMAHFGGAPSIVAIARILPYIHLPTIKDMGRAMGHLRTYRPKENIVWHIGHETTPGFKA